MRHNILVFLVLWCTFWLPALAQDASTEVLTGAESMAQYLPMLQGRRVGLVVNQTAVVRRQGDGAYIPLPDTLLSRGVDVRCIMAPEHGYKGIAEAGAHVGNSRDAATGLSIYSLYGDDKKPRPEWLDALDVVVFDIQDVGCRFYTYLSTLYYVMQACSEQHKDLIILDRPNPNDTVDGPTLQPKFESFVGIIPIPLMHGCTLGELARIMAEKGWLNEKPQPDLGEPCLRYTIIPCLHWRHGQPYSLPIAPSKNLQNDHAIALYPSLCLFEGSDVAASLRSKYPFEMYGKHDLRAVEAPRGFSLQFYLQHQQECGWGWITRPKFFNLLAGSDQLYNQLKAGWSETRIRQSWQPELEEFRRLRAQYAIYEIL